MPTVTAIVSEGRKWTLIGLYNLYLITNGILIIDVICDNQPKFASSQTYPFINEEHTSLDLVVIRLTCLRLAGLLGNNI